MKKYLIACSIIILSGCSAMESMFGSSGSGSGNTSGMSGMDGLGSAAGPGRQGSLGSMPAHGTAIGNTTGTNSSDYSGGN